MKKLRKIYLIDDDEGINFLNKAILSRLQIANEIESFRDPLKGLEALKSSLNEGHAPDLILLDINMPLMDGWEFVEQYSSFEDKDQPIIIIMLSSSIDPADEKKANSINQIAGFRSKPLTFDIANQLIEQYF